MSLGPFQIVIIALVILVFFGRGRISDMMGDVGRGITSFKKGVSEPEQIASDVHSSVVEPKAVDKHN